MSNQLLPHSNRSLGPATLFIISFLISYFTSPAQTATFSGIIKNGKGKTITLDRPTKRFWGDYFNQGFAEATIKNDGSFRVTVTIQEPEIIFATIYDDSLDRYVFQYNLFLSPGDNLKLISAIDTPAELSKISGKGVSNNQPLLIFEDHDKIVSFYKDTLPDRIYDYVTTVSKQDQETLKKYIDKYKPSASFIKAWELQLAYWPVQVYYAFEHDNAFGIRNAYQRNKGNWLARRNELFGKVAFSNDAAIVAPSYLGFLRKYLLRTKETLWRESHENKVAFLREWYGEDTVKAWSEFQSDLENKLRQKIIEKSFTGKGKEFLYGVLLESALADNSIINLVSIYNDFITQFPRSKYCKLFDKPVAKIAKQQELQLTDAMIFVKNGESFTTWNEVLQLVKGKTVLLDMWGTWCGPCRRELNANSAVIKNHFKGKGLDYLYIANYDKGKDEQWKKLIAFFKLEGLHIMANDSLTKNVMNTIKGDGYPTYAIIDKYGNVELSKAGYPMKRDVLIKQLEEALKK